MKFFDPKAFASLAASVKSSPLLDPSAVQAPSTAQPSESAPRRRRLR